MASEVDICNSALIKLGAERISSLTENNKRARLCQEQYPKIRDQVLRSHPWNFAVKREVLTPLSEKPAFQFERQFQLPGDCLKVWKVWRPRSVYKIEGDKLLSDDTAINLLYISKIIQTGMYDGYFLEALSYALAADLAYALVQSRDLQGQLLQVYEDVLAKARSFDGQEGIPDSMEPDAFTGARHDRFSPTELGSSGGPYTGLRNLGTP